MLLAKVMSKVTVTSWASAFIAALLVGILNPTIGWLLRGVFHVATLGIPLLLGLGFIIRLIVTMIIIKLVDVMLRGFDVKGWGTAFIIALVMALVGTLVGYMLA